MRRSRSAWAVGAFVVAAAAAGCLPTRPTESRQAHRGPALPAGSDTVFVQSALLELPLGDPFIDRELWAAGASAANAESRALLAENGLRAIVLGGNLPPQFDRLVRSEAALVSPQILTFSNRKNAVLPTNGPLPACEYDLLADLAGRRHPVKVADASCGVWVCPELLPDGRVRVTCEPQVQHGDRHEWVRPNADGTGFSLHGEVPVERHPTLAFDVALAAGDWLVVGSPAVRTGSLGAALFRADADGRPRQRVLVLRAGRAADGRADDLPAIGKPRGGPSVAAQASQ